MPLIPGATLYEMIASSAPPSAQLRSRGHKVPAASELGRARFSTQLGIVDRCVELDNGARPQMLNELAKPLGPPEDEFVASLVGDISLKMLRHFLNWTTPNDALYADEFEVFITCFPVIDLAWRLGAGMPTRDPVNRSLSVSNDTLKGSHEKEIVGAGFSGRRGTLTRALVVARVDEYAAAYLLDRQEAAWTYQHICRQAAKNCIALKAAGDIDGFASLLEDVVDRARGRIKKDLIKLLEPGRGSRPRTGGPEC